MTLIASLHHITRYSYDQAVRLGPHTIRLRPHPLAGQKLLQYELNILPWPTQFDWVLDDFGNLVAHVSFANPTHEFGVEVKLQIALNNLDAIKLPYSTHSQAWTGYPIQYNALDAQLVKPYLPRSPASETLLKFISKIDLNDNNTLDFVLQINRFIFKSLRYQIRFEPGVQSPEDTIIKGIGTCRDFAWLLIHVLHHFGFAARFVSGYLIEYDSSEPLQNNFDGTATSFPELHAWCEVYMPIGDWLGLDATSGVLCGDGHISLAVSPAPRMAGPIDGTLSPAITHMTHSMQVNFTSS